MPKHLDASAAIFRRRVPARLFSVGDPLLKVLSRPGHGVEAVGLGPGPEEVLQRQRLRPRRNRRLRASRTQCSSVSIVSWPLVLHVSFGAAKTQVNGFLLFNRSSAWKPSPLSTPHPVSRLDHKMAARRSASSRVKSLCHHTVLFGVSENS